MSGTHGDAAYRAVMCGLVVVACFGSLALVGCAVHADVETVERLERAPSHHLEANSHYAYGMRAISGQRHGFELGTGGADGDGRHWAATGLSGVPYRYSYAEGDEQPEIEVVAVASQVAGSAAVQRDVLLAEEGHETWLISRMRVPVDRNRTEQDRTRLESGAAYEALVRADLAHHDGPERARWRALRNVLEEHFEGRHGSFTGTVYLLRCDPQVNEPADATVAPSANRYLSNFRLHNAAGGPYLDFDATLVVSEHEWDEPDWLDDDKEVDDVLEELYRLTG